MTDLQTRSSYMYVHLPYYDILVIRVSERRLASLPSLQLSHDIKRWRFDK